MLAGGVLHVNSDENAKQLKYMLKECFMFNEMVNETSMLHLYSDFCF